MKDIKINKNIHTYTHTRIHTHTHTHKSILSRSSYGPPFVIGIEIVIVRKVYRILQKAFTGFYNKINK
jgi:hypothetical protein